eukprot:jgi/Astpho2/8660/Aster-05133
MRIPTSGCAARAEAGYTQQICELSRRQDAASASQPLAFAFLPHFDFDGAQAPLASLSQPQQVQEAYDSFAGTYDTLDAGPAASLFRIPDLRSQLLAMAQGRVLEAGIGTGINLPLYNRQKVQHITGVDLSPGMLNEAAAKVKALSLQDFVDLQRGSVEALDQPSSSFDCIVDTFSLCVYPDPVQALREMARVVKPGGRVLLLEHSRSAFEPLGRYQDATAPAVAATGKGCKWNQDIPALLRVAGLQAQRMQPSLGGLITLVVASKADSNDRTA